MKVICGLLVLLAVFEASQCRAPKYTERLSLRTPFFRRQRIVHSPLIVGGSPADIANFPHHLGLLDLSFGGYICGAANISPLWALSAAHCLEFDTPASLINLWGGSTSRLTGGHVFIVDSYNLHPNYDWWTLDNDIAVLRVADGNRLENLPNVQPIAMSNNCATACCDVCIAGSDITVTGWGANEAGVAPINLLQVQKSLFDHAECGRLWGGISDNFFCTTVENGRDSCGGDSGGPIIRDGRLVGLVSFGSEICGDGTLPAVYVRLEAASVRNWVRQMTSVQAFEMKSFASVVIFLAVLAFAKSLPTQDESVSGRIVNGRDADIADFPHHLGLFDQGRYFCGASVLSPQFALTAAHCLDLNTPPTLINLWGGSTSRFTGGHVFFVDNYFLHPQYRRIALSTGQVIWDFDVAVIRVNEGTRLEGFPFIEPISLPPPCSAECCGVCGGVEVSLAGWGRLANGSLPTYLQQLEQHVILQAECRNHWEGQMTSRMFCVTADFYDSCDGDSGSAILANNLQVGYVSFGSLVCGDGSAPAVYGRIEEPSIREFIREISGL